MRLLGSLLLAAITTSAYCQLDIPSDGTDGVLNITANTTIDLSQAITGNWQDPVPVEDMGKGIYDPTVWAVVYKYESVTVNASRTVSFTNHPSGAPVVWLVDGDVLINGTVSVSANSQVPGPGGFHGGRLGGGLGPGGGDFDVSVQRVPAGSYGTTGQQSDQLKIYGNAKMIPLIGGSGGAVSRANLRGGRAGGGAILIAASGRCTINGPLASNGGGGDVPYGAQPSGGGSGGGIRIIASIVDGTGYIRALGLCDCFGSSLGTFGGNGRIRIEALEYSMLDVGIPAASFAAPDEPPIIFPDETTPIIRSIRLDGRNVPSDPKVLTYTPGMTFDEAGDYNLEIEAMMVPQDATIEVRITPSVGAVLYSQASFTSGNLGSSLWTAVVTLPEGRSEIQARAVLPNEAP